MKWILWTLILTAITANAATTPTSNEQREFYTNIRSLGMGDTGVAIANDESALLTNPAGLGKLRDFYGTLFDPEIDMNSNAADMYRTKAYTEPWNLENTAPAIIASPGQYFHFRGQVFPSFVMKNFGIGILYKRINDGYYDSNTNTIDTFYQDDFAINVGYNLRLFEGRIKIGVVGRLLNRIELVKSDLPATPNPDMQRLAQSGDLKSGTGFATDVGVMLAAPWVLIPTLGVKMHDLGGTSFTMPALSRNTDTTVAPTPIKQDMDVGFSIFPIHTNNIRSTWTIEYKNALTADQQPDKQKLYHFGTEFNFSDIFFVRFGYNQRYYTAGLELASERFQLQFATYGEEVGTITAPSEDRRYVGKFTFRF